jgi:hypothetical protein
MRKKMACPPVRARFFHGLALCLCATPWVIFPETLIVAQQPGVEKKYPHDVHYDFRGKPLPDELSLTPFGSDQFIKSEPEGLRITLPKNRNDLSPVVVGTRTGIQGDFEITATLEILKAEQPKDGFGVGASLFINKVDPAAEGATLGRLVRPKGKQVVFWDLGIGKKKEELQFDIDFRPYSEDQMRLRLKRTGTQLSYLLAKGLTGENFDELPAKEFGGNDIEKVLVRVTTGQQPVLVDVRLIELRIRSGAAPATPIPAVTTTVPYSRGWLLAGSCVMVVILLFAVVVLVALLYRRQRGNTDESEPPT